MPVKGLAVALHGLCNRGFEQVHDSTIIAQSYASAVLCISLFCEYICSPLEAFKHMCTLVALSGRRMHVPAPTMLFISIVKLHGSLLISTPIALVLAVLCSFHGPCICFLTSAQVHCCEVYHRGATRDLVMGIDMVCSTELYGHLMNVVKVIASITALLA